METIPGSEAGTLLPRSVVIVGRCVSVKYCCCLCFKLHKKNDVFLPRSEQCFCRNHTLRKPLPIAFLVRGCSLWGSRHVATIVLVFVFSSSPTIRSPVMIRIACYYNALAISAACSVHTPYIRCSMQYAYSTVSHNAMCSTFPVYC